MKDWKKVGDTTISSAPFDTASLGYVVMQFSDDSFIWLPFPSLSPCICYSLHMNKTLEAPCGRIRPLGTG